MEKDLFSPTEQEVIKKIGKKPITISKLSEKVYFDADRMPLNPRNTVAGIVRRINDKCEYHKLPWFINGSGLGRGGKEVWKDKR